MHIRAYDKDGNVFENRDFGDIMRPNIEAIKRMQSLGVFRFTVNATWWSTRRCRGTYKFGTATGTVDTPVAKKESSNEKDEDSFYQLFLEFNNIEDGRELYMLIRSGNILPVVSFDQSQIETTVLQIRSLIRELKRAVFVAIRSRITAWRLAR